MKSVWKYVLLFLGVLVLAFCAALPLFSLRSIGMVHMAAPMFQVRAFPFFMGGGWLMMGLRFLPALVIGAGLLVMIIVGIVALTRRSKASPAVVAAHDTFTPVEPAVETVPCAHCGQPLQAGWVACPHCGSKVGE